MWLHHERHKPSSTGVRASVGRVMGVVGMCGGAGPLGMLHTGALAEWLGADVAIGVIAIEGLASLALALWIWPALRKWSVDAPAEERAPS